MAGRAGAAGAAEAYDEVSLHQLVENAVTKDDVAPLVRVPTLQRISIDLAKSRSAAAQLEETARQLATSA